MQLWGIVGTWLRVVVEQEKRIAALEGRAAAA
jgi:hypothetical protein